MDMNILGGVGSHLIIRVNTVSLKNHLSGDHFTPGYFFVYGGWTTTHLYRDQGLHWAIVRIPSVTNQDSMVHVMSGLNVASWVEVFCVFVAFLPAATGNGNASQRFWTLGYFDISPVPRLLTQEIFYRVYCLQPGVDKNIWKHSWQIQYL